MCSDLAPREGFKNECVHHQREYLGPERSQQPVSFYVPSRKRTHHLCSVPVLPDAHITRPLRQASWHPGTRQKKLGYIELQVTTHYSFRRGASHIEELMTHAAVLRNSATAITDRTSLVPIGSRPIPLLQPVSLEGSRNHLPGTPDVWFDKTMIAR